MLEITFKGKKINIEDINVILVNDLTFTIIIFIWYTLYQFGIYTYNSPLFALIITFIQNLIIISLLFYNQQINISNILKYFVVLVLLKIIPIISFYYNSNFNIYLIDIFFTFIIYLIYLLVVFIIIKIYSPDYDIKKKIMEDLSGKNLKDEFLYHTYDYVNNLMFNNIRIIY
jgi:hypothetical protein